MREKFRIAFFIVLMPYIAVLSSGSYVGVYYTYFALPILPLLGILAFGNIEKVHNTAKVAFTFSVILTIVTVASVSYVGVYVPSIVAIILFLSAIVMFLTKEK